MSEHDEVLRLEGIVRATRYHPDRQGKQFLGAMIECNDGQEWVIDYDEQSPFHAFADRQVMVTGEPYRPEGQLILGRHFRVSTMRLVEVTPDAELVELGPEQKLSGRFERETSVGSETTLSFITDEGDTFRVANYPAGATVGRRVEVRAYPVQPSPSDPRPPGQYLWIICPYSAADLWEWRGRRSGPGSFT